MTPAFTLHGPRRAALAFAAAVALALTAGACAQFRPQAEGSLVPGEMTASQMRAASEDRLQERLASLDAQVSELAFQIRANREAIEKAQAALAELDSWRAQLAALAEQVPAVAGKADQLEAALAAARRRIAALEQRLGRQDRTLAEIRSALARNGEAPRFGIHIADFPDPVSAAAGWIALKERLHENVKDLHAIVKRASGGPENPEYVQLVVGPFAGAEEASARCAAIKPVTSICDVVTFSGDPLDRDGRR